MSRSSANLTMNTTQSCRSPITSAFSSRFSRRVRFRVSRPATVSGANPRTGQDCSAGPPGTPTPTEQILWACAIRHPSDLIGFPKTPLGYVPRRRPFVLTRTSKHRPWNPGAHAAAATHLPRAPVSAKAGVASSFFAELPRSGCNET